MPPDSVPVAKRLARFMSPENKPFPCTDNLCEGELVPNPNRPVEVKTFESTPVLSYISIMFAVWPTLATRASVVVALAPERIESFAYGVELAPIAT